MIKKKNKLLNFPLLYFLIALIGELILKSGLFTSLNITKTFYYIFFIYCPYIILTFLLIREYSCKNIFLSKLNLKNSFWFIPSILISAGLLGSLIGVIVHKLIPKEELLVFYRIGLSSLIISFSEELIFRYHTISLLIKRFTPKKTVLLNCLIYTILNSLEMFHYTKKTELFIFIFFIIISGMFLSIIYLKIENIIPLILFHWLWNFSGEITIYFNLIFIIYIKFIHTFFQVIIIVVFFIKKDPTPYNQDRTLFKKLR